MCFCIVMMATSSGLLSTQRLSACIASVQLFCVSSNLRVNVVLASANCARLFDSFMNTAHSL